MKYLSLLLLFLFPAPAFADEPCADLWWSRNHLFDQAGYCFASPLGQSVFDNSDCTTKAPPKLSPAASKTVSAIREEEARWGCKVDTKATTLELQQLALRRRLEDVAVNDGLESACLNYLGPEFHVHAAARDAAPIIGTIRKGDNIGLAHYSVFEGWLFVSYGTNLYPDSLVGWVSHDFWKQCEHVAG